MPPEKSYRGNSKKRGDKGKGDEQPQRVHKNRSFDGCSPHRMVRTAKSITVDGVVCDKYECRNCTHISYYPTGNTP